VHRNVFSFPLHIFSFAIPLCLILALLETAQRDSSSTIFTHQTARNIFTNEVFLEKDSKKKKKWQFYQTRAQNLVVQMEDVSALA